jgi:ABC-2 type transport system permease protein
VTAALRAEWTKVRTVPDLGVALLLTVVLTVAVAAVAAAAGAGSPDPVHVSLIGVQLGQAVVAAAGVQLLAGEFGTGLIRTTFAALPRRREVFAAKAILLTAGVTLAAVLAVGGSVLAGWLLFDGYPGVPAGTVLRAAVGSVLYLTLIALLGLGAGAALRNAAADTGLVLALLYLVPAVLRFFADRDLQDLLYRLSPSTAGQTVQTTVGLATMPIGPWAGLAVTAGWAAALATLGAALLARRDA